MGIIALQLGRCMTQYVVARRNQSTSHRKHYIANQNVANEEIPSSIEEDSNSDNVEEEERSQVVYIV